MADFDINSHLQNIGFGRGKTSGGGSDGTNEKSTIDSVIEGSGKSTDTVAKLTGIPVNLTELGQHGLQKAFGGDTEGLTGKTIMPSLMPDAQGGFLARLLHDIFIKNREIADHTSGTGGGGDAAGGGGGGGDFGGGGGFTDYNTMSNTFSDLATPSYSYDWSPVPMAMLGEFSPPNVGERGPSVGTSVEV